MTSLSSVDFGSLFLSIRNGLNIRQDKNGSGLPITRIETISSGDVDSSRVGFANVDASGAAQWLLQPGDILFSHINSPDRVGHCALYTGTPRILVHGMNLLCLRPDPCASDSLYLLHLLRSAGFRRKLEPFINRAVNQASVSIANLRNLKVDIPPLYEQRRIAAILGHAGDLRRNRRIALEKLTELPQAIFHEMFGDPTTNERGWLMKPLGSVVNVVGGFAFKSTDFADVGSGIVRISNLRDGVLDLSDIARIPASRIGKGAKYSISGGDILMAMSGATTGKVGIVPFRLSDSLFLNQRVANFRISAPNIISREFLIVLISSDYYQKMLWQAAGGVAQPNVSSGQLEAIPIPLPPIAAQHAFSERLLKIVSVRELQTSHLKDLDTLFASLQHHAFAGTLTPGSAQAALASFDRASPATPSAV